MPGCDLGASQADVPADTGQAAPVDAFGHLLAYTDGNNVSTVLAFDQATGVFGDP